MSLQFVSRYPFCAVGRGEALGGDVGDVVGGENLHEANGLAGEAPADHGIARRHPLGGFLEAFAASAVNDGLGVREEQGGGGGATPTSRSIWRLRSARRY